MPFFLNWMLQLIVMLQSSSELKMFEHGCHADGKLSWISLFHELFPLTSPILDLCGNEEDMFLSRQQPTASSKYSGTCSSPACPGPTKDFASYSISLRYALNQICLPWIFKILKASFIVTFCNRLINSTFWEKKIFRQIWNSCLHEYIVNVIFILSMSFTYKKCWCMQAWCFPPF